MKASEQQALIPQEATPDTLIDLIGKTQQVTKAAAVVLKACRNVMDTKNKQEHIDKWGGIHAITEAVYDCADLAQRILDAGLAMENMCAKPATSRQMILIDDLRRSLDMEDGDVEASIDPDTGEVLPEGSKGELVFTSLDKEAFPVIRYRTRDICMLTREKCTCGRTHVRMHKPMGRSDDMMIIRGVNVFPSQIETVLLKEGYSSNYQILVDRVNNSDTLDINVEMAPEQFDDTVKAHAAREKALEAAIRAMLGIGPKVHLVAPKSITRSEGKAVRVIDKRKLHD